MAPPSLTIDNAELLVKKHLDPNARVLNVVELANHGTSYTPAVRTFVIDIAERNASKPSSATFITLTSPPDPFSSEADAEAIRYEAHTLSTIHAITTRILSSTSIPIPSSVLDVTLAQVPFQYILASASPDMSSDKIMTLAEAKRRGHLGNSPNDPRRLKVDILLGRFLGEVHKRCVNDWFGVPDATSADVASTSPSNGNSITINDPKPPNSYSWQESFTMLFESVLSAIEAYHKDIIPFHQIRLLFSRVIGSFLFDDVEEPSLVWFTGSEEDIYINLAPSTSSSPVAAILPNLSHAVWGDPLLESFFVGFSDLPSTSTEPSQAFMEAYTSYGGSDRMVVFPRQRKKRTWYTLFLALVVLKERLNGDPDGLGDSDPHERLRSDKVAWAKQIITECVQSLEKTTSY